MAGTLLVRKHLSADALVALVRSSFANVADPRPGRPAIPLADALMSAFAMFALKDPSLLAFDQRRHDDNLRSLYRIGRVPSDTQMRAILDQVPPEDLRPSYQDVFRQLQRGKALEPYVYLQGCYLLSLDGTGYFSSQKVHCASCMQKEHADGTVTYYHQMLGAALVTTIRSGLLVMGIGNFWLDLFLGLFLLAAVLIQRYRGAISRRRPSRKS